MYRYIPFQYCNDAAMLALTLQVYVLISSFIAPNYEALHARAYSYVTRDVCY